MRKDIGYYKAKLKNKETELEILREIAETISYNWDLQKVLSSIIGVVQGYSKSDSCFIYLVEDDHVVLAASQNPHREMLGKITLRRGEGITGWVAEHKRTVALESQAYEDERFKFFNALPEDRFEAFLSLPIVFKDKVVGVINIQYRRKRKFVREKVRFLEIIARQVGGAIENARLITETGVLKQTLETRKIVEKAKGIIMKRQGLSEAEAQKLLHKKSMDNRKSLREVAEAVILSEEIAR
ncbi:MAG: GAF and ANTAR domain-containing protein [Candidatus Doudnabacteria bacterium]|nr:GAF and ANTAR domain-containing protein [Candidatus Doudnabacteria bacterium]